MVKKPRLSTIEKWILWHLRYPGEYQDIWERRMGWGYSVTPKKLIHVLPKPMLREINDVNDARQILDGLREKSLVHYSNPNFYSMSTHGVLIFRKYIEDEVVKLFTEPEKTRRLIGALEKKKVESTVISELRDLPKKVKEKAKNQVADYIVKHLIKAGALVLWHVLGSG